MNVLARSIVTDLLLRSVWWDKKNMVLKRRLGKKDRVIIKVICYKSNLASPGMSTVQDKLLWTLHHLVFA